MTMHCMNKPGLSEYLQLDWSLNVLLMFLYQKRSNRRASKIADVSVLFALHLQFSVSAKSLLRLFPWIIISSLIFSPMPIFFPLQALYCHWYSPVSWNSFSPGSILQSYLLEIRYGICYSNFSCPCPRSNYIVSSTIQHYVNLCRRKQMESLHLSVIFL